ncbi:MAG: hypothetical protein JSS81_07080 [Acidobacteria bacterium]|nr:hypothetical protein [Acidobacteriota bacterium]
MGLLYVIAFYAAVILVIFAITTFREKWKARRLKAAQKYQNKEILKVLFGLDEKARAELFELYKKEFGAGPARYARKTLEKWRAGRVTPNYQTFERFLRHLPRVMSYDLRCELLRHFMEEYAAKDRYELTVYTDDWETKLTPLVEQIIDKAYTTELPVEVERKLLWLGEGDMKLAQEILRRSQAAEGRLMVSTLRDEFASLETLFDAARLKPKVTHELKFPYGTITLDIKRRK